MSEQGRRQPHQRRSAATVDAIVVAARALLQEHDDATCLTVRTVAERADLSPAAVYRYFENLDQVIDAVLAQHAALAEHTIAATLAAQAQRTPVGLFREVVQSYLTLYTERPDLTVEFRSPTLARRHRELETASDRRLATILGSRLHDLGLLDGLDTTTLDRLTAHWNAVGSMIGEVLRSSDATRPALRVDLDALVVHAAARFTHEAG